jgi:preprotein translocase YajC subunit
LFASILQFVIFAADQPATPEAVPDTNAIPRLVFMATILIALFYLMVLRPQKRKEQDLRNQVSNLKESDRVITIGGIYGVVTNVQRDAQRVTIRVDESTGTKLRLNMSAISRVLTAEEQEGSAPAAKSTPT